MTSINLTAPAQTSDRATCTQPEARPMTVMGWLRLAKRAWQLGRTRLLWSWRLAELGPRSVLDKPLQVNNARAVAIGARVTIGPQFVFGDLDPATPNPKIFIGDGCTIVSRFQCNAARCVRIGKNVLMASNVLITDSDHVVEIGGLPVTRNGKLKTAPVRIGDNCWIGQNAVIVKGVTVGDHCIIGANTVVTKDVPSGSIVVGSPARIIGKVCGSSTGGAASKDAAPTFESLMPHSFSN